MVLLKENKVYYFGRFYLLYNLTLLLCSASRQLKHLAISKRIMYSSVLPVERFFSTF
jgi:hypothetical protein